jgi:ribosomal protein S18 acetylase RimI-like enzyme
MDRAIASSSVVVCAWQGDQTIGCARAISDFAWCGYLAQLAVIPPYQHQGVGRKLVEHVVEQLDDEVSLLVHSEESAVDFYEMLGFKRYSNVYRFARKK